MMTGTPRTTAKCGKMLIVPIRSFHDISSRIAFSIGLAGIVLTVWLFSVPDSRAATFAAIIVVAPTFASLAISARQALAERENQDWSADELAESVEREWAERRLSLLGDYALPANVHFTRAGLEELASYRSAGGWQRGTTKNISEYFHTLGPQRFVILGASGSGKTMLAIELLIALLAERKDSDQRNRCKVPVFLNMSSWDSRKSLRKWITEDLVSTYSLSKSAASGLVRMQLIIPILDGLDEIGEGTGSPALRNAIHEINTYASYKSLGDLIITCRDSRYIELAGSNEGCVQDATAVLIEPLTADQVATYLSARYPDRTGRNKVQGEWYKVCTLLRESPPSSLADILSTPWRLAIATAVCDSGLALPLALARFHTVAEFDNELLPLFVAASLTSSIPDPLSQESKELADRYGKWLQRLATVFDPTGAGIVLDELWKVRHRKRTRVLHGFVSIPGGALTLMIGAELASGLAGLAWTLSFMAAGAALGAWAAVDSDPSPSRLSFDRLWNWRYAIPVVAFGSAIGGSAVIDDGWKIGLTLWFLTTLAGTVLVGLRRGTAQTVRPGDPLKNDLIFGTSLGLVGGAWAGLPGGLTGGVITEIGVKTTIGTWPSIILALVLGVIGGISIGARAWMRYVIALAFEALPDRLPWRLNGFLNQARLAGLVRVTGLAYQFRHESLRSWLKEGQ
jgi:NACHT domain